MTKIDRASGAAPSVFHLSSSERAKRVAKALVHEIKAHGVAGFPYTKCQELVARMYGHRTHQALLEDCGKYPATQDDAVVGEDVALMRRTSHVAVLVAAGIEHPMAETIVTAIAPTRRADPRRADLFESLTSEEREKISAGIDYFLAVRRFDEKMMILPRGPAALNQPWFSVDLDHALIDITGSLLDDRFGVRLSLGLVTLLEERGRTIEDLEWYYLASLLESLDYKNKTIFEKNYLDGGKLPSETRAAAQSYVKEILAKNFPSKQFEIDRDEDEALFDLVLNLDLIKRTFWNNDTATKMIGSIDHLLSTLNVIKKAGGTLRDIIRHAGIEFAVGSFELGAFECEFLQVELWNTPSTLKMLSPDECDAAFHRAVERMLARGRPAEPIRNDAYFRRSNSEPADGVWLPGGSYVFLYDIAASAEAAGYGIADLVASASRCGLASLSSYEREALDDENTHHKRMGQGLCREWIETFTACAARGRHVPELVAMSVMLGISPSFDQSPQAYFAATDRLISFQNSGISLLDLSASALGDDIAELSEEANEFTDYSTHPMATVMDGGSFGPGEAPDSSTSLLQSLDVAGMRPS